jgi:hypothetical protein
MRDAEIGHAADEGLGDDQIRLQSGQLSLFSLRYVTEKVRLGQAE